ncbi:ABC transporter ATP-binding protein [Salisediminibacterium halotolerans]|uniref:ABC transporter ATP-binding protein n=1 Tax=Salisediminibacterium halotolerans TaxID=517425 RepID=UPI000EAEB0C2|nr:ABC transporter ATP-binding protein [Salisediminibacterium halotolerans]RLJ71698.1 ABC-2 type transport system ATP-binding protein [Actinophytocola xinjiangensis]RPE86848.1 ABC-2 type transport system ATP-binding protein [Salisediminibacterium halotolerans]TWG32911.1 ABC-2 type transport system ATP-binding protein [Salisediminibacterium halotolerans]GEL07765.1 ABC transporter ATP-binding protein [Salisediminibacterium halotolerans]
MTEERPVLSVQNVSKTIEKTPIIHDLSFDLYPGEVFGFLGPNGSGKTTTIRMIVGLIKPTEGAVTISGHDVQKQFVQAMQNIGSIVENPEMYDYLSGWENLKQYQRMIPGITEKRMHEVIKLVGMTNRVHDLVRTYSLGMRQRLGIAQALLNEPKVLILDEPANGLDPKGIREMREFIRTLAEEEGLSVLVSSHLLSEIQLMCDRVAIISKGRILAVDHVDALLAEKGRVIWQASPAEKARPIIAKHLQVIETAEQQPEAEQIVTLDDQSDLAIVNEALVAAGVKVHLIERRLPSLEDLFLDLTGGESID